MTGLGLALLGLAAAFLAYTYAGYPMLLGILSVLKRGAAATPKLEEWPSVSIVFAAFNEEQSIGGKLENLLELEYPVEKRQILVISDASTDGTDGIVGRFADRGVELLRLEQRRGKDAAENAALPHLRGEIVVNTDASVRFETDALERLIAVFADDAIGVASGRDVSVARQDDETNVGESRYVGYEMWVRSLETRVSGIVGASGCFYAIRSHLHDYPNPVGLSRDFAAALVARERGYRAVSVNEAICYVPRGASLWKEYSRKVRTMSRGLATLWYRRHLLNPIGYGVFAWMLFSHKLCRWLVPWTLLAGLCGLIVLSLDQSWARWTLIVALAGTAIAGLGWTWPRDRSMPRLLALPTFMVASNVAALHAWFRALRGRADAVWEPTRREALDAS